MMPEQKILDALSRLKADQLELDFCPTCGQEMPRLRCAGCDREITLDDVFVHNDLGRFCAETACVRKAFRTLL